jgi:hypothetical protein
MKTKELKELVFPYGNVWFYPVSLIWCIATAVFYITFPALLTATHMQSTGFHLADADYAVFLSDLLLLALTTTRFFILFLIASGVFDAIYEYRLIRRNRGYL